MLKFVTSGLLGLAFLAAAGTADAALITDSTDAALSGSTTIDFDSATIGNDTSYTFGDVTFATIGGTLRIAPFNEGGDFGGSGQNLSTRDTTSPSSFSITFGTTVSAFGMLWLAANPDWTVQLFDISNNLLETVTFIGGNVGATFSEFYGASNNGISRVALQTVAGSDWVLIDNFQFVTDGDPTNVPEPGTLVLFAAGLFMLGGSMLWRRRVCRA